MPSSRTERPARDRLTQADRILDAARRKVVQVGASKLSLTDVAALAGVSRPTLYRYFPSKEALLEGLGRNEYERFGAAMNAAVAGVTGVARLETAIDAVCEFMDAQPGRHLVDLEPGFVNDETARVLPMMATALAAVLRHVRDDGVHTDVLPNKAAAVDVANAIARIAMSHYLFPDADASALRRQMRVAAGLPRR